MPDLDPYTDAEVEMLREDDEQEHRSLSMLAAVLVWALLVIAFALLFYVTRHLPWI